MAVTIEICLADIESAVAAREGGAHRLELCASLSEGGTTPSRGLIDAVKRETGLPVAVLVRPRGGDFLYSARELDVIRRDIEAAGAAGADAVVLGALRADGRVDVEATASLTARARPMEVVFHRAFDLCREQEEALRDLMALGIDRVLTSGGAARAGDAVPRLAELVRLATGRPSILVGGGIDAASARRIAQESGAREFHFGSAVREDVPSAMQHRRRGVSLGTRSDADEYLVQRTSAAKVRAVVEALRDLRN